MTMETMLKINYTFSNIVVNFYKIFKSLPCTQHDTLNDNSILSDYPTHKMQIIQPHLSSHVAKYGLKLAENLNSAATMHI